jgi:2-oxoisovalerate dehydrogenase E1 component
VCAGKPGIMQDVIKYYKKAFFIREFENFLIELFKRGELNGTVHTCVGQELIPVVLSSFLKNGDRIFSNHRGHGHFLAFEGNARDLLAEILGLETGVSKGIGGSQHLMNDHFISNGIQGGMTPIASGYAYANKLKQNDNVAVVFIGDGTLGSGVLYESLNLASVFSCPVIFVLENNQYAQSTSHKQTFRGDVSQRVAGFGLKYSKANIWDVSSMEKTFSTAVNDARRCVPVFVEVDCYRLNSHSKGDDNRTTNEIESYNGKDLLNVFAKQEPAKAAQIIAEAKQQILQLYDDCKQDKPLSAMKKHAYIVRNDYELKAYQPLPGAEGLRINKLVYLALKDILEKHQYFLLIGEDIQDTTPHTDKNYGGAFKVTQDLSTLFPEKVHNTPISEAGIIGFGTGAALNGVRSITEIMFGDFLTLGFDQLLQQASKIPEMFGRDVSLPYIIRTPMGGRRGYGPTHSQNLEKHFLFLPNIEVVALNSVVDPRVVYKAISEHNKTTTIVIEDKIGYTKFLNSYKANGYEMKITDETFPTLVYEPVNIKANCTLLVYGGMLDETLEILERLLAEDIFPRVICPVRICPFNIQPVINSLRTAEQLIIIEEGSKYGGLSSEVIAYLEEHGISFNLKKRISNESIIPCARTAEKNVIPNAELIFKTIIEG